MENASKALIIAAGILIAVLTITVIAVLRSTFSEYGEAYEKSISTQNIQEFNTQFLKYENKDLTIQDVMTIANLVKEWNNTGDNKEKIDLNIQGIGDENAMNYNEIKKVNSNITAGNTDPQTYTIEIKDDYYSSGRIRTININKT